MANSARGRILQFTGHSGGQTRGSRVTEPADGGLDLLQRKSGLCSDVLTEAGRLVALGMFAPALSRLIERACDLLDEVDEMLIGLDPVRDHRHFAQAAELHRRLETIQSQLPREFRRVRGAAR